MKMATKVAVVGGSGAVGYLLWKYRDRIADRLDAAGLTYAGLADDSDDRTSDTYPVHQRGQETAYGRAQRPVAGLPVPSAVSDDVPDYATPTTTNNPRGKYDDVDWQRG